MDEDYNVYITNVLVEESARPSAVLKANGEPYYVERVKQPIGFILKPKETGRR
jgi:hypothetical protein